MLAALTHSFDLAAHLGYRAPKPVKQSIEAGDLHWSDETGRVTVAGVAVLLRPREFRLLGLLMGNAGVVQTRGELLTKAWGGEFSVGKRTIDVHIRRLRMSLQPFGMDSWIQTVPTRGYRFYPSFN